MLEKEQYSMNVIFGQRVISCIMVAGLTILTVPHSVTADDALIEPLTSTGRRIERTIAGAGPITVIDRDELDRMQVITITEALDAIGAVDLLERGFPGSQADISLRGSSSEGVLVMVNGIPMRDPQTAHFTLDLPVSLSSVDRIEVLTGGGSSRFGSSASGGIINIVTLPDEGVSSRITGGSFGSAGAMVTVGGGGGDHRVAATLNGRRSDGYRPWSSLESWGLDLNGRTVLQSWQMVWQTGLLAKTFGAGDFYAAYPSTETTRTFQGGLTAVRTLDWGAIRVLAGAREHGDDYILDGNHPALYRNTHNNRSITFGVEYLAPQRDERRRLIVGAEMTAQGLTSGSLGNRRDSAGALYGEGATTLGATDISWSLRLDTPDGKSPVFSPGGSVSRRFGKGFLLTASAERTFRMPTYTERYYQSPANQGDPDLDPERGVTTDVGMTWTGAAGIAGVTLFHRTTTDAIDWVRYHDSTLWMAKNHGRITTQGIDLTMRTPTRLPWTAAFSGTLLDQDVRQEAGIESKYLLNPLTTSAALTLTGPIGGGIESAVTLRREIEQRGRARTPTSIRFNRILGRVHLAAAAHNLFDEQYDVTPGLPAPGRWFEVTLEYRS